MNVKFWYDNKKEIQKICDVVEQKLFILMKGVILKPSLIQKQISG